MPTLITEGDNEYDLIVAQFTERLPERVAQLVKFCADQEWNEAKGLAHKLAVASMFNLTDVGELSQAIERLIGEKKTDKAMANLEKLKRLAPEVH